MENKYARAFGALLLLFGLFFGVFVVDAHAEEPEENYTAPSSGDSAVTVTSPELNARLDAITGQLQTLIDLLTPVEDVPAETPAPTADPYLEQLGSIEETLLQVADNTVPATPETALPAFEKPFEEYSVSETLLTVLACVLILLFVVAVYNQIS